MIYFVNTKFTNPQSISFLVTICQTLTHTNQSLLLSPSGAYNLMCNLGTIIIHVIPWQYMLI